MPTALVDLICLLVTAVGIAVLRQHRSSSPMRPNGLRKFSSAAPMRPRPGAFSGTRRGRRLPRRPRAFAASASQLSSRGYARTRPSARRTAPRRPARPASAPSGPSRSAVYTEAGLPPPGPRGSSPPLTLRPPFAPVCTRLHPFAPLARPARPRVCPPTVVGVSSTARAAAASWRFAGPLGRSPQTLCWPRIEPVAAEVAASLVPSNGASPAGARRCLPVPVRAARRCRLPLPARRRVDLVGIRKPNGKSRGRVRRAKDDLPQGRAHHHADGYDAQCRKMPTIQKLQQQYRQHRAPRAVAHAAASTTRPPPSGRPAETSRDAFAPHGRARRLRHYQPARALGVGVRHRGHRHGGPPLQRVAAGRAACTCSVEKPARVSAT